MKSWKHWKKCRPESNYHTRRYRPQADTRLSVVNYPSLLARGIRRSLPEGGAFMWTPGSQSSATARGPSSVIVPRFKRTFTGASPPEDICDERSRWCSFRAYRSPMFFAAL